MTILTQPTRDYRQDDADREAYMVFMLYNSTATDELSLYMEENYNG